MIANWNTTAQLPALIVVLEILDRLVILKSRYPFVAESPSHFLWLVFISNVPSEIINDIRFGFIWKEFAVIVLSFSSPPTDPITVDHSMMIRFGCNRMDRRRGRQPLVTEREPSDPLQANSAASTTEGPWNGILADYLRITSA